MTKKAKTLKLHRWDDIRAGKMTAARVAELEQQVEQEIIDMDLKEIRELAGRTQNDIAAATKMTQSEISRLERRPDFLLSTLRRYIEGLGGELEVTARFGDRSVRLKAVG